MMPQSEIIAMVSEKEKPRIHGKWVIRASVAKNSKLIHCPDFRCYSLMEFFMKNSCIACWLQSNNYLCGRNLR